MKPLKLHDLKPAKGAVTSKRRKGRVGSGLGKTSGRGHKDKEPEA